MGICAKCQRKTEGTYSLCYACMEKVKREKFQRFGEKRCPKCGTKISKDRPLCWNCLKKSRV
ncbi:hypothetical protein GYA13_00645 [Candidatus Kuenenbacteria bacterium]|nr:hypothetical protein [Candidatus Kuenenbacteria bacterium]